MYSEKIKKIFFIYDYYRGEEWQHRNIEIIYACISPFFSPIVHCKILHFKELYFDIRKYMNTLSGYGESILSQIDFTDTFVIGFEINPIDLKYLNSNKIPWINFEIHPIRFLDDLYFNITSSVNFDFSIFSIAENEIILKANILSLYYELYKTDNKNGLLIVGQSPQDKSVYFDCEFKTLKSYETKLKEIVQQFENIYYRPHPYLSSKEIDDWILDELNATKLSNDSYYKVLSSNTFSTVCGISSSSLIEASYFSKQVIFLENRRKFFDKPISINSLLHGLDKWSVYVIGKVIDAKKNLLPINTMRDMYGYWSYDTSATIIKKEFNILEKKLITIEQNANEANTRATKAEQNANEANTRATKAEQNANEANTRATKAEQNANEANTRATKAEQNYTMLLSSYSWKITKPLRFFAKLIRKIYG